MPFAWQMDTAVARNSWCYTDSLIYKSSGEIISALVDTVSKNGNMLLNIGPKADGTIPDADRRILEDLAAWMKVNAEAIRGAGPWTVWAEGPTRTPDGEFSDQKALVYTSEDYRFTVNRGAVYAVAMVCPRDGHFVVRTLGKKHMPVPGAAIRQVYVLGYEGTTFWRQDEEALHVNAPGLTSPWPVVLKITSESFKGERGCAGYAKA
ncbi:MAG: alpha-L-fucosidase [Aristaeellaceae bacterium]